MEKVFKYSNKSIIFSIILVLVSLIISISIGAAEISIDEIIGILLREFLGYHSNAEINNINKIIVLEWRLPRFCLGFLVGASLAIAGCGFQGVFKNPLADPFLLGKNFVDVDLNKIKNDFGESFSQSIKNMELNKWVGPIKSPYGHHIVFISNYKDGYFPEISMVLKQVEIDLLQLRRDSAIQKYLEEIQSEYKIYINPELTF